jgi:hypothetical protein
MVDLNVLDRFVVEEPGSYSSIEGCARVLAFRLQDGLLEESMMDRRTFFREWEEEAFPNICAAAKKIGTLEHLLPFVADRVCENFNYVGSECVDNLVDRMNEMGEADENFEESESKCSYLSGAWNLLD